MNRRARRFRRPRQAAHQHSRIHRPAGNFAHGAQVSIVPPVNRRIRKAAGTCNFKCTGKIQLTFNFQAAQDFLEPGKYISQSRKSRLRIRPMPCLRCGRSRQSRYMRIRKRRRFCRARCGAAKTPRKGRRIRRPPPQNPCIRATDGKMAGNQSSTEERPTNRIPRVIFFVILAAYAYSLSRGGFRL